MWRSRRYASVTAAIALAMGAANPALGADRAAPGSDAGSDVVVTQLDGARSRVGFSVRVMWLLRISGHFGAMHGNVRLDRFRNQIRVDAQIDANTVSMNEPLYENWVKSAEFFDVARYPFIEFISDAISQTRLRKGGELPGVLILRGIRQPVRFTLQPSSCAHPGRDCPIEVTGSIRRSAFAMRSRRGTVGDKVTLHFSVYSAAPGAHSQ
jgi:polyisoprenoid-binding protein YceI